MASQIGASAQGGPALFHRAQTQFRRMVAATPSSPGAISQEHDHGDDSAMSDGSSLSEVSKYHTAPTSGLYVVNPDIPKEIRRETLFTGDVPPSRTNGTTVFKPRRHRLNRRLSLESFSEDEDVRPAATERTNNIADLAAMRRQMDEGFDRLDNLQQQLEMVDQALLDHMQSNRALFAARSAREAAAADDRIAETKRRLAHEQRRAYADRVEQRIVADVVPFSAGGRACSDFAEIRRYAAPKVFYQMVSDSNYPRFGA